MKLLYQCCTLEQAKRLRELGVIQKSLFYWHNYFKVPVFGEAHAPDAGTSVCNDKQNTASAYTVAELGLLLPDDTRSYRLEKSWQIYYPGENAMDLFLSEDCDTEAQIRAAHLIWLLETNAITADEVNKRLAQ